MGSHAERPGLPKGTPLSDARGGGLLAHVRSRPSQQTSPQRGSCLQSDHTLTRDTDLWPRQGSRASWSHSGPVQPGWHSHTTLSFSTERHRPCLHTLHDLQPGDTPSDCGGSALKSCSSLLMRTSWMQPWKPPSGRSAPWRKAERPVEVGMPVGRTPGPRLQEPARPPCPWPRPALSKKELPQVPMKCSQPWDPATQWEGMGQNPP